MTSYIFRIIIFALLVDLIHLWIVLNVRSSIASQCSIQSIEQVKYNLAKTASPPRILILGGSNAVFGLDASEIEKKLHRATVNLGIHAGLELSHVLRFAYQHAKPSDTIVLALEQTYYEESREWTKWKLRRILAEDSAEFDRLPINNRLSIALTSCNLELSKDLLVGCFWPFQAAEQAPISNKEIMERFYNRGKKSEVIYSYLNLDDNGDIRNTNDSHFLGASVSVLLPGKIQSFTLHQLRDFISAMKNKNIKVYFTHTPYVIDSRSLEDWRPNETLFVRQIHSIGSEVLETRSELFFPRDFFFDTAFHLNERGRTIRTERLIEALRRRLF